MAERGLRGRIARSLCCFKFGAKVASKRGAILEDCGRATESRIRAYIQAVQEQSESAEKTLQRRCQQAASLAYTALRCCARLLQTKLARNTR